MRLLRRHWRGELPLSLSLTGGLLLAALPVGAFYGVLVVYGADVRAPWAMLAVLVAFHALVPVCLSWYAVGCWRAAGGRGAWGWLARLGVMLGALVILAATALSAALTVPEGWAAYRDDPDWEPSSVRLRADGRAVLIDGPMRWSVVTQLDALLKAHSSIRLVHVSGPGGRVSTGFELFDMIHTRGLETLVTGDCSSACTDAFLAGKRRWLGPAARLGFHQGGIAGNTDRAIDDATTRVYREAGLQADFIVRVLTGGHGLWVPTQEELLAARVATDRARPGLWPMERD